VGPHNVPGKKPQQGEEKPADKLASILPVTQNNAYKINTNSITTICAKKVTQK